MSFENLSSISITDRGFSYLSELYSKLIERWNQRTEEAMLAYSSTLNAEMARSKKIDVSENPIIVPENNLLGWMIRASRSEVIPLYEGANSLFLDESSGAILQNPIEGSSSTAINVQVENDQVSIKETLYFTNDLYSSGHETYLIKMIPKYLGIASRSL